MISGRLVQSPSEAMRVFKYIRENYHTIEEPRRRDRLSAGPARSSGLVHIRNQSRMPIYGPECNPTYACVLSRPLILEQFQIV